jgi:hypothetical protein
MPLEPEATLRQGPRGVPPTDRSGRELWRLASPSASSARPRRKMSHIGVTAH